jgi:hypothetical protein
LWGHGRPEFAASLDRQRALTCFWIAAGSTLKDYTHIAKLPARRSLCHPRSDFATGSRTNPSANSTLTSPSDQLLLSAYAERTADRVWTISAASLLAAIDTGRDPKEFAAFLAQRAGTSYPAC